MAQIRLWVVAVFVVNNAMHYRIKGGPNLNLISRMNVNLQWPLQTFAVF